jgi:uncharacterized membrane protein YeiH
MLITGVAGPLVKDWFLPKSSVIFALTLYIAYAVDGASLNKSVNTHNEHIVVFQAYSGPVISRQWFQHDIQTQVLAKACFKIF